MSHDKCTHGECPRNGSCPDGAPFDSEIQEAFQMAIEALSTQQWIPFGRPMNSGRYYLVTLRQRFEGEETYRVRIMRLHEGHWVYPRHFPEWINDEMEQEVIAWMPIPEPYQAERREE